MSITAIVIGGIALLGVGAAAAVTAIILWVRRGVKSAGPPPH